MDTFLGYPRPGGRAGTRNYLAIIPTVFCANEVVARIAKKFKSAKPLLHHQGCAQLKPDVDRVTQTLISLGTNPNVGAVLLVGLGCESVSIQEVYRGIKDRGQKVAKVVIQDVGGMKRALQRGTELAAGLHQGFVQDETQTRPREPSGYGHQMRLFGRFLRSGQ